MPAQALLFLIGVLYKCVWPSTPARAHADAAHLKPGGGEKRWQAEGGSIGRNHPAVEVVARRHELRKTEHTRTRADGPEGRFAARDAHSAARVAITGQPWQICLIRIALGDEAPAQITRPRTGNRNAHA